MEREGQCPRLRHERRLLEAFFIYLCIYLIGWRGEGSAAALDKGKVPCQHAGFDGATTCVSPRAPQQRGAGQ